MLNNVAMQINSASQKLKNNNNIVGIRSIKEGKIFIGKISKDKCIVYKFIVMKKSQSYK
jgi:hypothetical protein